MAKIHKEANIYEFDPVIYPYKLWIIIGEKQNEIENSFSGSNDEPIKELANNTKNLAAFVMPVSKKDTKDIGVLVCFYSKGCMTYEIVAHESSHAAKYLFEHIGADIKEHEPFEFIVGWIAGCCEKVKKNKINNGA